MGSVGLIESNKSCSSSHYGFYTLNYFCYHLIVNELNELKHKNKAYKQKIILNDIVAIVDVYR